jgi:hypothetical protein
MPCDAQSATKKAQLGSWDAMIFLFLLSFSGIAASAQASTECVNPNGTSGCYNTISAAVLKAGANDTIEVAAGTYREDVVIGKPLSLIGEECAKVIIDATGLANGIYIDGFDNTGLVHVVVTGFTVENANFEGILVQSASLVTIWGNHVIDNDQSLVSSSAMCPGLPGFKRANPTTVAREFT